MTLFYNIFLNCDRGNELLMENLESQKIGKNMLVHMNGVTSFGAKMKYRYRASAPRKCTHI